MKKILVLSIALSVISASCNKKKSSVESSVEEEKVHNKVENFSVDSLKINDSMEVDKNLTAAFQSEILVFQTIKDKALLDSIYAPEELQLPEYSKENLLGAMHQKKKDFYDGQKEALADWKPDFKQTWNYSSSMTIFSNNNDFLTIQYTNDGYTGGAHGYYNEIYKVFDLKINKTVQLKYIIKNTDAKVWNAILMDNFLKNDLEKDQAQMLIVKEISPNNNFYFDKENLYFLYNEYEITAYAAGTVLIKIPLSDIKPLLTSEFISRQNL